ncbi:MAG: hypothetical protein NVS2B7_37540 [Herpetosiphon sp.]
MTAGAEMLAEHTDLTVVADKGYVSAAVASTLWQENRVVLLAERRQKQHTQVPPELRRAMNRLRQFVETINRQLMEQYTIKTNHQSGYLSS